MHCPQGTILNSSSLMISYEKAGDHWHVRVWQKLGHDWQNTGTLVMSDDGCEQMKRAVRLHRRFDPATTRNYEQLRQIAKRNGFVKWVQSGLIERLRFEKDAAAPKRGSVYAINLATLEAHKIFPRGFAHRFQCFEVTEISMGELHEQGLLDGVKLGEGGAVQDPVPGDAPDQGT